MHQGGQGAWQLRHPICQLLPKLIIANGHEKGPEMSAKRLELTYLADGISGMVIQEGDLLPAARGGGLRDNLPVTAGTDDEESSHFQFVLSLKKVLNHGN